MGKRGRRRGRQGWSAVGADAPLCDFCGEAHGTAVTVLLDGGGGRIVACDGEACRLLYEAEKVVQLGAEYVAAMAAARCGGCGECR